MHGTAVALEPGGKVDRRSEPTPFFVPSIRNQVACDLSNFNSNGEVGISIEFRFGGHIESLNGFVETGNRSQALPQVLVLRTPW